MTQQHGFLLWSVWRTCQRKDGFWLCAQSNNPQAKLHSDTSVNTLRDSFINTQVSDWSRCENGHVLLLIIKFFLSYDGSLHLWISLMQKQRFLHLIYCCIKFDLVDIRGKKAIPLDLICHWRKDHFPFVMPRNHTPSSQRHLKFNQNKLFGCFPRKLPAFLYPPSPPPPSAMKGCLHGCDVSISTVPSPDATCFYYNRLVPLVLIRYSVCSRPSIHQKYIQLHSRLQLSVLLFFPFTASPCCLFAVVLSPFLARVKCACSRACAACAHEDTIGTDAFFWFWCFRHQCHTWQLSSQNTIT